MARRELDKVYQPKTVEERWYAFWLKQNTFHAQDKSVKPPFSIVIPPPNITGSLHLGHALNNTLQDILIRWKRMSGFNTLWLPGTDHAGIATQNVVERQLMAEGKSREALGRKKFIERVWQWREQSGRKIIEQLKRLGASCDWERERFTMDEGLSAAVREVFVRMYDEGLIYRGERLINWCPRCETALSDIEVEHEETQGKMYYIKYPLADDPKTFLTVATTRPETMLGDTAVAVHPEDPRYNRLIGRQVALPLTHRKIPVVGDSILVDREFGTGAVKITPGHDFNDYEAGLRHRLPIISILTSQAEMDSTALDQTAQVEKSVLDRIKSLKVREAREQIVEILHSRGLLLKVEDHRHAIGKCYRCKTVVEPFLSPQWFVKTKPLAEPAIEAVRSGKIKLIPEGWENTYFAWMENIKDWCISRQIWWGHQIPAWYCKGTDVGRCRLECKTPIVSVSAPERCPHCGSADLVQDPDVLDTWFSSALWPFSTLGWPEKTAGLSTFYPTSVLVTSFDIIFFWVARMIMMGLKFMGEVPFKEVYIHALVRDAEGQKMSKSKGNVIDPLEVMDKYGTDALRFTLASMASPGRDIKLSEDRIEGYRNFANKIWNAARFILMNLPDGYQLKQQRPDEQYYLNLPLIHRWIYSRLDTCTRMVNEALEAYRFDEAARYLYQFIWHEYCDWYLEMVKVDLMEGSAEHKVLAYNTLSTTFEQLSCLLHPFMPFITEELWQHFPHQGESITVAPYPKSKGPFGAAEIDADKIIQVVTAIRNIRSENNIPPSTTLKGLMKIDDAHLQGFAQPYIIHLARLSHLQIGPDIKRPPQSVATSLLGGELYLSLQGVIDFTAEEARLEKKRAQLAKEILELEKKLKNPDFVKKALPLAVAKTEGQYNWAKEQYEKVMTHLEQIRSMAREK
jgi:valyl-tRNA synthetase